MHICLHVHGLETHAYTPYFSLLLLICFFSGRNRTIWASSRGQNNTQLRSLEGREEQMDENGAHRGTTERTQRGNAATWFPTWALPTSLAVRQPRDGEGREWIQQQLMGQSLERGYSLGSLLLGAMEFRGSVPASPSRHQREEIDVNGSPVLASSNLSWLASVFFVLLLALRPTKIIFYSLDIKHCWVFRVKSGTTFFPL